MNTFWAELSAAIVPGLVALFGTIGTIIINRAARVAQDRWGIEIEARHREALHSAIMSGVLAALARGLTGQAVIQAARVYAQDSVPDAIRGLPQATEKVLASIAEAKLREALSRTGGA